MKNLIIYYFSIVIPIPMIIWSKEQSFTLFTILFLTYLIIFRGFVDGQRLIEKKVILKKEIWKAFIPFWTAKYTKELYFEK